MTKLFVVEDDKARADRRVETGLEGTGWVEVIGDAARRPAQVVTTGQTQLADGTPVVVRDARDRRRQPAAETGTNPRRRSPSGDTVEPADRVQLDGTRRRPDLAIRTRGRFHDHFRHLHQAAGLHLGPRGDPGGAGAGLVRPSSGVDLFPDVDFPVCTVTTVLPGASVEEMETSVTKPIEDIINTVSGIDELRSTTMEGVSIVTVQFLLSKNGDVGTQEVRDKVNTILADLPDGTEPPIIDKFDTGSMPVMTIAVSGRRDFREVTELARKQIKERLETVNGVGAITLVGGRIRAMNVVVDTDKLAGYNLSVEDVRMALRAAEPRGPRRPGRPGAARAGPAHARAGSTRRPSSTTLIVANRNGYPIRVRDVGRAEDSFEEPRTAGPARRRQRRQPGRPEAVGDRTPSRSSTTSRRGSSELKAGAARRTSRPRSSATSRGSSRSRSRR